VSTRGLEIVVLIAPVHDCLNPVKIEPGGKGIDPSSLRWTLNPYDAFALEEALCIRDVTPGTRVRLVAVASSDSEEVVRGCLAAGADDAARIWEKGMEGSDSYATATVLAAALRKQPFDLLLCGWRRADLEHGQVGPALAEVLDLPQVTGARKIEPAENETRIRVHKRVPGYLTKLSCPLPALVTIEKGQVLRYPSLAGRHRAARAEIPSLGLDSLGLREENVGASGSTTRLERFTPPKPTRRSAMASTAGKMTAAARLQRIMGGGVQEKKDSKIWECPDEPSTRKVAEHIVKEKLITF
jgi:electron transfer flavoprotein beta subunit